MSEVQTPIDTDPPTKKKETSKSTMIVLVAILVIAWIVFGFMRKPGAVSTIMGLSEDSQRLFVLSDGQGSGGLGTTTEISDAMKAAQNAEPIPAGKKGVWYTFYPPMEEDEAIKKEVKGGNGWTLENESEERYSWKGKYEVKLRAPATNPAMSIGGIQFMEKEQGVGEIIGTTLKNMLP